MVPLGMMVVVQKGRCFLSSADEGQPVSYPFRMSRAALDLPEDDLVKVSAFVGPLFDASVIQHAPPRPLLYMV
jgi:hypothetical protein